MMSPRLETLSTAFSLAIVLVHVFSSAGQTNFVSTSTRRSLNSQNSDPWVQCSPVPGAELTLGRYVSTRNGGSNNPQPPTPRSIQRGDPLVTAIVSFLDTRNDNSYGSFYCASSVGGSTITVPIILLRSDASFIPANGRFTKTVCRGDMDVTIEMTERPPSDTLKNWRINGTTSTGDVDYAGPNTTYLIPGAVQPSNEGVYEVHLVNERQEARGGLMRLIVRACPAGRYDVANDCVYACGSCYNGGICDDRTGDCICPPGFQGTLCDKACDGSLFGLSCEFRCKSDSTDRNACRGFMVCIPDPYGCSCAAGYKGLDCNTECDVGEYGSGCTQSCHCESGQCNRFTGECTGTPEGCSPGWTGGNCQRCIAGRYGPDCLGIITVTNIPVNEGQGTTNFTCQISGSQLLSSAPPVLRLYRNDGTKFVIAGITVISYNTQEMAQTFRVEDVQYGEEFRCWMWDVNAFRSEVTAVDLFVLPQLPSPPRVTAMTNDSVTLMWDAWNEGTDVGDGPLVRYNVYFKIEVLQDWTLVSRSDPLAPSETIRNLTPDTDYMFAVSAVRKGTGGEGDRTEVAGSTGCSPPDQSPMSVQAHNTTTPRMIPVTWENPTMDANCRSGYTGVKIYYTTSSNTMSVEVSIDSPRSYNLSSLKPYAQYSIYMTSLNKDSESARSEVVTAMTAEGIAPAPTVSITASSSSITVMWDAASPANVNGNILRYEVRYTMVEPTTEPSKIINVTTNQLTGNLYVIEGLKEGSTYEVQVRVINGAGIGEWSEVKQEQAVDPAPAANVGPVVGGVAGVMIIIIIVILVIVFIIIRRKKQKQPTELVDNVLYESTSNGNQDNGHAFIDRKPALGVSADTEYAYVSHERNSLLNEEPVAATSPVQKEPPISKVTPVQKHMTLPLLASKPTYSDEVTLPRTSSDDIIVGGARTDRLDGDIYENVTVPGDILVEDLVEYVELKKANEMDGFHHDYNLLKADETIPWTVASKPENKTKNRFKNIIAYDHSRVPLELLKGVPHSDYYNANYIYDHKKQRSFIAAQAPNQASLNDFWRMIWQEKVCTVVMVTNTIEGGKDRCQVYWPKSVGQKVTFGKLEVSLKSSEEYSDHIVRSMVVKEVGGDATRSVYQFHYQSWPDMGVPQYPTTLISFTQAVKQHHTKMVAKNPTPMLVHCSAGVGRTGTFISLYCMVDMMNEEGKVNVFDFVRKMRENRIKMVQTADQYVFIHTALVESYLSGNTEIPASQFSAKITSLEERNLETNKLNVEQEFEILNQLTPPAGMQAFKAAVLPVNHDKNRFHEILPMEKNRPFLVTKGDAGSTDYINASFMNTFMKKDVFVATQMPLPNTTGDIWRLAYDWKCPAIVMLNELDQTDKTCAQYWPNQDSVKMGSLTVAIKSAEMSQRDFIARDFQITGSDNMSHVVRQFQLLGWPVGQEKPDSTHSLLQVTDAVSHWMRNVKAKGPIIVHCINGIGRSGVFCTIYSAVEKMLTDNTVDIFQAVKRLRANRPSMVESVAQYRLCYDAMTEYLKRFDEYANLDLN